METETIAWKSEYSVGLLTADKQHKRFLSIINDLGTCIDEKAFKAKGNQLFYSLLHFADVYIMKEKMLVNSVADLDYSYFREKHKHFIAKLQHFKDEYNEKASEQLFMDLYCYLKEMYPKYLSYYTPSLVKILKESGIE